MQIGILWLLMACIIHPGMVHLLRMFLKERICMGFFLYSVQFLMRYYKYTHQTETIRMFI